jgi:polyphosphate kinase 2 (PPK2 family)
MLKNIDLSREVAKAEYKRLKGDADLKLAALQRQVKALGIPVVVVFEGWSAAGKGTLINELILPLDPRGFTVHSASRPTEEEAFYPFLWRFWKRTPTRGRLAIFDRSWNRRVVTDRVEGQVKGKRLRQAFEDIRSFERQLADEGVVIAKCFLHISKKEQKRRFDTLRASAATAWRVTDDDRRQHQRYAEYLAAAEDMLTETDADYAPWTVVEAHDRRFATLKIFATVIDALERGVAAVGRKADDSPKPPSQPAPAINAFKTTALDHVDLSLSLTPEEYVTRLKKAQAKLRELEHQIYLRRVPVVIAYEGVGRGRQGGKYPPADAEPGSARVRGSARCCPKRRREGSPLSVAILGTDAQGRAHHDLRPDVVRPRAGRAGGGVLHGGSVAAGVSGDHRDGTATGALRDGPTKVLASHRSGRAAAAVSGATGNGPQAVEDHRRGLAKSGEAGSVPRRR